jgi:hypothetical protein
VRGCGGSAYLPPLLEHGAALAVQVRVRDDHAPGELGEDGQRVAQQLRHPYTHTHTHTHTQSSTVPLQAGCCVLRLQRLRFWSHTSGLSTGTSSSYTVSSADVYAFCTPNSPPMHQVCVRHIDASGFVYDTSMHQALCTTRRCIRLCVRHIDASGFVYDTSMHQALCTTHRCIRLCVRHIDASGFVYDTSMHQALCTTHRCIRLCVRHVDASASRLCQQRLRYRRPTGTASRDSQQYQAGAWQRGEGWPIPPPGRGRSCAAAACTWHAPNSAPMLSRNVTMSWLE